MSEAHANLGPYNGFGFEIPFVLSLGIELHEFADGASLLRFAPEACHLNSFDVVHGGALMTLLDVTLATAARSVAPDNGIVTIEMKSHHDAHKKSRPSSSSSRTSMGMQVRQGRSDDVLCKCTEFNC